MPGYQREREALLTIARQAVAAVSPGPALRAAVRLDGDRLTVDGETYDLNRYRRVLLLGAGKGAAAMAEAMESILGDRLDHGLVVTKYGHGLPLVKTEVLEAAHPVPDEAGVRGAERLLDLAESAREDDLVLCIISGGASALIPAPQSPVTLADKQEATRCLLACGADIHEINAVRKHLSRLKGGRLARALAPATVASLIISDVVGDDLDVIASGPTAPDSSTYADCRAILDRYRLCHQVPQSVEQLISTGCKGGMGETCKATDDCFARVRNVIVAGNGMALNGAANAARQLGYEPVIVDPALCGEARDKASEMIRLAAEYAEGKKGIAGPVCLLAGGETTVTIRGNGKGGRNQEFALAAALELAALGATGQRLAALSLGTDGTDGPTDAAGGLALPDTAVADRLNAARAALDVNDAYTFLDAAGTLLKTGPTRTNVMDVAAVLVSPKLR
ncbi:glycerate kinase type-2 family protein [Pseudodesulfovibrio sp.]|uniref:glycerate kinase type-2 family protein n=1 Tax=unclassified Pseudodesulfovibrio TaxID=2661612 RepID=UPI003B00F624